MTVASDRQKKTQKNSAADLPAPKRKATKLARSTLYYSLVLGLLAAGLMIAYMLFLMPRLYQAELMKQAINEAETLHKGFLKERSYAPLEPSNFLTTMTFSIPKDADYFFVDSKAYSLKVQPLDAGLAKSLQQMKDSFDKLDLETDECQGTELINLEPFVNDLSRLLSKAGIVQVELRPGAFSEFSTSFTEGETRIRVLDDDSIVIGARIQVQDFDYLNILAMTMTDEEFVLTMLPTMSDRLNPLLPTLAGSLPMIIATLLLSLFLASQFYTRRLTKPIVALADEALQLKAQDWSRAEVFGAAGEAGGRPGVGRQLSAFLEIQQLRDSLDELYEKLRTNYHALEAERARQEFLLRASAHQLKTPLAAALLLVEGMIDKLGPYANAERYLPEVKQRLLSMQQILAEILSLNRQSDENDVQELDLSLHLEHLCAELQPLSEQRQARFRLQNSGTPTGEKQACEPVILRADPLILDRLLENLLTNALKHSPPGALVELNFRATQPSGIELEIINPGAQIPAELLPRLFEAFVVGGGPGSGHGLGLYLANFYVKLLGGRLTITNCTGGVRAKLSLPG